MFWTCLTSLHHPQTFNTAKLLVLNRFTEAPRDSFKFGGNLSYFTLYLTDNLTMTNFFLYPLTFRWALTLNIFSKVPHGESYELHFLIWFTFKWFSFILTCCLMNWNVIIQFRLEVSDHNIVTLILLTFQKMLLTYYCDTQKQSSGEFAKFVGKQLCWFSFLAKLQVD